MTLFPSYKQQHTRRRQNVTVNDIHSLINQQVNWTISVLVHIILWKVWQLMNDNEYHQADAWDLAHSLAHSKLFNAASQKAAMP